MSNYSYDWADLAFGNKKPLKDLKAIFIAAPREISERRFRQLVKTYLPQGNIVLGLAKEPYITGFENQPQFKTLNVQTIQAIIDKVNSSETPHKIHTLAYFQREQPFILEKLGFKKALFVNGSWKHTFHSRADFYTLVRLKLSYELISPFVDETEAHEYEAIHIPRAPKAEGTFSEVEMLGLADKISAGSFDNSFQTGVALGRKQGDSYSCLALTFNKVVPYQTYAWHNGASRETHFSPMHDLNHYDAIHAEVALIIKAQKEGINLIGTTLFINLLPCPMCARMFTQTDIAEFVYREDHSEGYAIKMLELAGKKVRRIVP